MPEEICGKIGYALFRVQEGRTPPNSKPLKGFHGAGVVEIIEEFDGDAYRAVYTVRFASAVYVLHVFQKKSHRGSKTPRREIEKIADRLKQAQETEDEQT